MNIKHLQPLAIINVVFAILLFLITIFFYIQGTSAGFIYVVFIIFLLFRKGLELDLNGKRYRKIISIFGLNIGKWKTLPPIEYISVFKTIKNSRLRLRTAETTLGFVVYKLNLFYNKNQHLEVYIADEKEDAFKVANQIAKVLNVEIYDATEKT